MSDLFFDLIKVAVGAQSRLSRTPSAVEWSNLYSLACKHSLIGVCFVALHRLGADSEEGFAHIGINEMLFFTWMGMAAKIKQRNEVVNHHCIELQTIFASGGFKSSVLKGQTNLSYYGDLGMYRQSGDIDLYVGCGRKNVLNFLQSYGMRDLKWDYVHTHAPFFDETEVEVHYRAGAVRNVWKNRRLQQFWKEHESDFFDGNYEFSCGVIVSPSERMHLFYLIYHSYRHLFSGGIGMRQMMDIYFSLKSRDVANDEWLISQVEAFDMKRFAEALMWTLQRVFGMNLNGLPWVPNEQEGSFLLEEIMIGGDFGKDDKRFGARKTKVAILLQITKRNLHLASHYGSEALYTPFYYVWHFFWKRLPWDG